MAHKLVSVDVLGDPPTDSTMIPSEIFPTHEDAFFAARRVIDECSAGGFHVETCTFWIREDHACSELHSFARFEIVELNN